MWRIYTELKTNASTVVLWLAIPVLSNTFEWILNGDDARTFTDLDEVNRVLRALEADNPDMTPVLFFMDKVRFQTNVQIHRK